MISAFEEVEETTDGLCHVHGGFLSRPERDRWRGREESVEETPASRFRSPGSGQAGATGEPVARAVAQVRLTFMTPSIGRTSPSDQEVLPGIAAVGPAHGCRRGAVEQPSGCGANGGGVALQGMGARRPGRFARDLDGGHGAADRRRRGAGTLIALAARTPVAGVCLVERDMPGYWPAAGLTPWIKGRYVIPSRSEEHTSELQSQSNLVC